MNKQIYFPVLTAAMLLWGSNQLFAQTTYFSTGFEYNSPPFVIAPDDINGADGQIGTWSGDEFPEGIGDILGDGATPGDSAGFADHPDPAKGTVLVVDRPLTFSGAPGTDIGSFYANLTEEIPLLASEFSFEVATRRTSGNRNKVYDIIGRDNGGQESFHLRVNTQDGNERLAVYTDGGANELLDLPTIVGEDAPGDLDNAGFPFNLNEVGSILVRMGSTGYTIEFESPQNAYRTASIPFNGSATSLSQIEFTYVGSDNTGISSGYMLDNILVTGQPDLLFGDFDSNQTVDMADFMVLAENFGTGTLYGEGDINFDAQVDLNDFVEFVAAINAQGQGATAAAVPEPGSVSLLGIGTLLLVARRRRQGRNQ